jgi:hypothetical protein
MLVNGEQMQAGIDEPRSLKEAIHLGHEAIIHAIDGMYIKYTKINEVYEHRTGRLTVPIQRGSIFVMNLGVSRFALSNLGKEFPELTNPMSGVFANKMALKPVLHPYWNVVKKEGFIPEARRIQTTHCEYSEIWLAARDTPLKPPED